jgi:hypothetical protein
LEYLCVVGNTLIILKWLFKGHEVVICIDVAQDMGSVEDLGAGFEVSTAVIMKSNIF